MEPVQILIERLREMGEGLIAQLPQITLAVVFIFITVFAARLGVYVFEKSVSRSRMRRSLIILIGKLISIVVWIIGLLIAATILFPSLTPASMLAGLGIGSLAIGLAFKDIFENFLAGILILLREPMRIGDFVRCDDAEGKVEKITVRDTYLRRSDGQLVLMPNAMLFKNPVFIRTDLQKRRTTIICGVAYDENVDEAREVIRKAVESCDSIDQNEEVQIFAQEFADSSINFEVTWWTGSRPVEVRKSRDEVVSKVKAALDEAGIEIPFPYRTLTFKEPLSVNNPDGEKNSDEKNDKDGS